MTQFKEPGLIERGRQDELLKVAEQAAAWLIELEDGGDRERAAFGAWLEESPLHVEMFLRASSVDRITELMAPEDVRALAQRQWDETDSVVHLLRSIASAPVAQSSTTPVTAATSRKLRFAGIAAGLLALAVGGTWYETLGPGAWDVYETQIGEQRTVSLADGSVIYVNADSRVEVHYSHAVRDIRLRDGEALFKVEHDTLRPFQVHVADSVVQAVGTQFNIYRRADETKVAVVEGVVQISHRGAATQESAATDPKRLSAGQGLSLSKNGAMEPTTAVNVAQVTAWRQRRLVFEWRTLEDIVAEFNRYNRAPQIAVEGDTIRQRRYTAVFDADNPQTLLKFLSKDDRLEFAAKGGDFVIRERAASR